MIKKTVMLLLVCAAWFLTACNIPILPIVQNDSSAPGAEREGAADYAG